MVQTPDVKADSAGAGFGADDVDGFGGQGGSGSDVGGLVPCWSKLLSHGDGKGGSLGKMLQRHTQRKRKKSLKMLDYVGSSLGKSLHG